MTDVSKHKPTSMSGAKEEKIGTKKFQKKR